MSQEQPMQSPALAARRPGQLSLARIRKAPGITLVGLPELIGLAGAALIALITIFAYFYFYVPAQSRLSSAQFERQQLQEQLRSAEKGWEINKSVSDKVDEISSSMQIFETNYLPAASSGRMSLYTTLNELIKDNGLRNTAGPSYAPLEPVGTKPQATAVGQSNAKWQTIYPGVAVSVTVEGPYQRVRHFVRDIESSRQFLIINAVELEGVTQSGVAAAPLVEAAPVTSARGPAPVPATGGKSTLVSLRLEMATYFRRPEAGNPN